MTLASNGTSVDDSHRTGATVRKILTCAVVAGLLSALPVSHAYATEKYGNAGTDDGAAGALAGTPLSVATNATATSRATDLVMRALSLLGVNYKRGGNSPQTGLDCSGLVHFVFHDTLGLLLPRRAEEISRVGETVQRTDLQPGDLVFYNTLRRTFSHVGIYLGEGRFIHAPASGGSVRIENMNMPYWLQRFNGARRMQRDG